MNEKPYPKPEDGVILVFKDHAAQDGSAPAAGHWVGTDLARFAQDVVALNSRARETRERPQCQVAQLESMQRELRIKKKTDATQDPEAPVDLSRFRKE